MQSRKPEISFLDNSIESAVAFLITLAVPADAPQLAVLHAEALPPGWSAAELSVYCGAETRTVLKAEESGIQYGFAVLQFAAGEAEILTLAIRKQKWRQGVASSLMKAALADCRAKLISCIYLEVAQGNAPALSLYRKFGFRIIAHRDNYYQSARPARETALIMRLDLGAAPSPVDPESCSA
jgi:[ribosomal protein S18]-alanine N-acetyltransferase